MTGLTPDFHFPENMRAASCFYQSSEILPITLSSDEGECDVNTSSQPQISQSWQHQQGAIKSGSGSSGTKQHMKQESIASLESSSNAADQPPQLMAQDGSPSLSQQWR